MRVFNVACLLSLLLFPATVTSKYGIFSKQLPFLNSDNSATLNNDYNSNSTRIAVIGAGAAGSSAAYFVNFLAQNLSKNAQITIFEATDHIGGRVKTVDVPIDKETSLCANIPNGDKNECASSVPVELGASIFVEANRNLIRAAERFNLTLQDAMTCSGINAKSNDDPKSFGIWDGDSFVYKSSINESSWWTVLKMIWKYHASPYRANSLVNSMITQFVKLYQPMFQSSGPHKEPFEFTNALNLSTEMWNTTALDFYSNPNNKVSERFVKDIIAAASRVNYAQNPSQLHGFGGLISMATSGSHSIKGGNNLIFQNFVNHSKASVRYNEKVSTISGVPIKDELVSNKSQWALGIGENDTEPQIFDQVIIATPLGLSGINLNDKDIKEKVAPVIYKQLEVTLLVTSAPAPMLSYFVPTPSSSSSALADDKNAVEYAPKTIYSTFEPYMDDTIHKSMPSINSLNYLCKIAENKWIVKIFSTESLSDENLGQIFGDRDKVEWVYRHNWSAYPKLDTLDSTGKNLTPFQLADGLYYINAFEPLVSTMETETVSAWNVAQLLANQLWSYEPSQSWAEWV